MRFFKTINDYIIEAIKKIRYGPPNLSKRREIRSRRRKMIINRKGRKNGDF